ncbi:MAG: flagellar biosynthetic protein FliR [Candidatus Cloacimonadota bacterium]|nr:MAG: flagellar biosynthetic protein FliR [Candidatus Cloacimonadota bacterium]PIE79342.1 MAG: flagellar biosynthetic protein FliR [Candidatus Delongbacteria bacterium]
MDFITPNNIESFFLAFIRVLTIVVFLPVLGYQGVDMRVKVLLSFLLAILLFPFVTPIAPTIDGGLIKFVGYALSELFIGITIGFVPLFIFAAFQFAGELMGLQMGLTMMAMMDPTTDTNLSLMSRLKYFFLMLIFLLIGGHLFFIEAIGESFKEIALGSVNFLSVSSITEMLTKNLSTLFSLGIKAGAPVVVTLFIIESALGIIARTVPQMNIFLVGFPLKILIGFITFITILGYVIKLFIVNLGIVEHDMLSLIKLLGG